MACDLVSITMDNWYYFGRIGTYKFKSATEQLWISRCGTIPTIISYTIDILKEWRTLKRKANGSSKKFRELLYKRKIFFIMKFCEYPI